MKISVTGFSVSIGASVFKLCIHLLVGIVYYLNENKDAKAHSFKAFFSIFPSVTPILHIWTFSSELSQQLLDLGLRNFVYTFR